MRCSRCGYIGFRSGDKCDNCHAKLKVAKTGSIFSKKNEPSDDSFSINPHTESGFAAARIAAAEYGTGNDKKSNSNGNSNVSNPFINEEGEFDLDLSEVLKKENAQTQIIDPADFMSQSTPEDMDYSNTSPVEVEELDEIDLGEIEVEGLGFDFDASDISDDEETESIDKPAGEEEMEGEPDTQETDSFEDRIETTDLNEYKGMNPSYDEPDEPVITLGETEDTTSDEIPDLSIGLDEKEAEQIREKDSEEPKLVIEDLGLELDTIGGQSTLNSKLDSEDSSN